jgi:NAD(P)-dependent dehydrogenase (short-subunit alcohol dehydrogenase family)
VNPGQRRVALVTAGSGGIGKGLATALAGEGFSIAFTYRTGGTLPDATLEAIRMQGGGDALAVEADFARRGAGVEAVGRVEEALGRVDVLVHAAGPMLVRRFERSTLDDYDAMLQTNLTSAVECAQAVLPGMRSRLFGRIVFFAMNGSHVTWPARGLAFYGAAKAGLVAFARTLALEEAFAGITVNVVEIGDIRDKEIGRAGARAVPASNPTGHAGSWEDVAYAVRFLVSDDAGFINGVTLGVNGGNVQAHERRT